MKNLSIGSPRQRRAIKALCQTEAIPSYDLAKIVGTTNIAEIILELRRRGWVIKTTLFEIVDQDGHICRPGKYSLDESYKNEAKRLLTKNGAGAAATAPIPRTVRHHNSNHSQRGEL